MKKMLCAFASLSVVLALSAGCHTVQGAGKDLETVGEKSQKVIDPSGQKASDYQH